MFLDVTCASFQQTQINKLTLYWLKLNITLLAKYLDLQQHLLLMIRSCNTRTGCLNGRFLSGSLKFYDKIPELYQVT